MNQPANNPQKTRIAIFQQNNSGREKVLGLERYGSDVIEISSTFNIDGTLPPLIDDPEEYLPTNIDADVVLSFLRHPDLLDHLVRLCLDKKIPVIASGKSVQGAITPFTCCGLNCREDLGGYGKRFGLPRLHITTDKNGTITEVDVIRGASCGATWVAAAHLVGISMEHAPTIFAREVQYFCKSDPSAFDPVSGKSSLHYAGHVHAAALKKALDENK